MAQQTYKFNKGRMFRISYVNLSSSLTALTHSSADNARVRIAISIIDVLSPQLQQLRIFTPHFRTSLFFKLDRFPLCSRTISFTTSRSALRRSLEMARSDEPIDGQPRRLAQFDLFPRSDFKRDNSDESYSVSTSRSRREDGSHQ